MPNTSQRPPLRVPSSTTSIMSPTSARARVSRLRRPRVKALILAILLGASVLLGVGGAIAFADGLAVSVPQPQNGSGGPLVP